MPAPIIEHDENRVRRAAEREGRRSRRRRAREVNMPSADMIQSLNLMPHYEGISSDDEQYELDISELKKQKGYYFCPYFLFNY
jgi:GC-rich sequence DNA-binding factor